MEQLYPNVLHPCWSNSRHHLWERIHLPVAGCCNTKCAFCDRNQASSCHTHSPGASRILMNPEEAVGRFLEEIEKRPNLRIAAVSGPGEPLANETTFSTLHRIKSARPDIHFCLSTNGILLSEQIPRLLKLNVETVSISISAINPRSAARIYEWAILDGNLLQGFEMGKRIIQKQLEGIERANRVGIRVKANTILIPPINRFEIGEIARNLARVGASLQNIVPLVPNANMKHIPPPSPAELTNARQIGSKYIKQFLHCHQCRSDVVGIPGQDTIL